MAVVMVKVECFIAWLQFVGWEDLVKVVMLAGWERQVVIVLDKKDGSDCSGDDNGSWEVIQRWL